MNKLNKDPHKENAIPNPKKDVENYIRDLNKTLPLNSDKALESLKNNKEDYEKSFDKPKKHNDKN